MAVAISKKIVFSFITIGLGVSLALVAYFDVYRTVRYCESETINLDGFALAARSCGSGGPTVIIEPGLAVSKESYYDLQKRLFRHAKVIAYDHAGIGESTRSDNPRLLPSYVKELKAMLVKKQINPPFILIGHSLGGHIIRYFTYLYPDEVAGLVFLDHPHEDWFRYIRANWTVEQQNEYFKWWNPEVTSPDQVNLIERISYDQNNDLLRGKVLPSNIPVLLFTGSNNPHFRRDKIGKMKDREAWAAMQLSIIHEVENAKQIIDWETGHWPQLDKPEQVGREIAEFIDKLK